MLDNIKKTLVVCGDSYLGCYDDYVGTHFTEVLSNRLNLKLISLARQGISNSAIRLQVDEALKYNPQLIIVGGTDFNRYEVPIHSVWSNEPMKNFNPQFGIHNLNYRSYPNTSKKNIDSSYVTMWSDHWSKYSENGNFDGDFYQAWKQFITYIVDENWKQQQDQWIIESSMITLLNSKIKFLYMPLLSNFIPNWLPTECLLDDTHLLNNKNFKTICPGYHTSIEIQKQFAEQCESTIQEKLNNE